MLLTQFNRNIPVLATKRLTKGILRFVIVKRILLIDRRLVYLLSQIDSSELWANNGLMLSGNKPSPEPLLTHICVATLYH